MAKHKLGPGSALIDGLVSLGNALDYVVETEFAVSPNLANPPAVDVAWLNEENQRFPLMIFEVESRASNSAANNALKVLGQDSKRFEKPLFFFHVILSGGRSSRVATLQNQYGTHNYRVYQLDEAGQSTQLIIDVLGQHRRLQSKIRLPAVLTSLDGPSWRELDRNAVLLALESAGFNAPYAATYARLTLADEGYRQHLLRQLQRDPTESKGYETYIGESWSTPIHLGLLAHAEPTRGPERFASLVHWQERSYYLKQIGPYTGLSYEYHLFLIGLAPTVWAITAALMRDVPGACAYIAQHSQQVLEFLEQEHDDLRLSLLTALWTLHIASAGEAQEPFEAAQRHINTRGGINPQLLLDPPTYMEADELPEWTADIQNHAVDVQDLEDFRDMLFTQTWTPADPEQLALLALLSEKHLGSLGPGLLASLNCQAVTKD